MIIAKGAEAEIHKEPWMGRTVVRKKRIPKPYRDIELDARIRETRTNLEAKVLNEAKRAGVPAPSVYQVNQPETSIIMEFIEGRVLREAIPELANRLVSAIFRHVGESTGNLHRAGIAHGDLTTANMIICNDSKVFFLDFSLSEMNSSTEEQGIDLLLLRRALRSTHYRNSVLAFKSFLFGYAKIRGRRKRGEVVEKMKEIEKRGRYFERKPDLLRQ